MNEFIKFPTTPHLISMSSTGIREEKLLTVQEAQVFLENGIVVEEKIDGANLGISFNKNGDIVVQNRGSILTKPYTGQWKHLQNWLKIKENELFDILSDRLILFGEWCYAYHSIYYNKLPDWFIAFDIYDKDAERFVSSHRRSVLLKGTCISEVPEVARGKIPYDALYDMIPMSAFSDQRAEGIYLRNECQFWLNSRAKIVRQEFIQAIESHWSTQTIRPNKLGVQLIGE